MSIATVNPATGETAQTIEPYDWVIRRSQPLGVS